MGKAKKAAMLLSSLSIYKGVRKRTVFGAFYALLSSLDEDVQTFLEKWGHFTGILYARGYGNKLSYCLSKAAFYDENAFSSAAAAGTANELPEAVKSAVIRDIKAIDFAGKINADDILNDYAHKDELADISETLPAWSTGDPVDEFLEPELSFERLSEYYLKNGCGMFARYRAFIWRDRNIEPVVYPDEISLSSMTGYDSQRNDIINNTRAFLAGVSSNNVLLYGDRGTGKSSTVKAILNEYYTDGLRMVEMPKDRLGEFPLLVERIAAIPLKFIIFIDDLSFGDEDRSYAQLKAVLEGGLAVRPDNTLIYATSNRRHLIKENFSDRNGDDMHRNDTMQETLSLSDRFGLSVNFSKPDKDVYLKIVLHLAKENNIDLPDDILMKNAEEWALMRGGRSPRCARQFISSVLADLKIKEEKY